MDLVYVGVAIPKDRLEQLLRKAHTTDKKVAVLKAIKAYLGVEE